MHKPRAKNAKIIVYGSLILLIFILAYVSWYAYPRIVDYIVFDFLGNQRIYGMSNYLGQFTMDFFFAWYTFITIGVGGSFVIIAWVWRINEREVKEKKMDFYPTVSCIIPAYNEEDNISKSIISLFNCLKKYRGSSQIFVIDDGSTDLTYEIAFAALELKKKEFPQISSRLIRHSSNLGKAEALKTGLAKATGKITAILDADSWWEKQAFIELFNKMLNEKFKAITGYIHPSNGKKERNLYIILQQLEYSQGLGIFRSVEALGQSVMVIPGPMGLYETDLLRDILNQKKIHSITEDFEITLEIQKRGLKVGYIDTARGSTMAPETFTELWKQRRRWFTGWLHNVYSIHLDVMFKKSWTTILLWYYMFLGYIGAFIEIASIFSLIFAFLFSTEKSIFATFFLFYAGYATLIGSIFQAIALKFAYNNYNHKHLLYYSPLYFSLRLLNAFVRFVSLLKYIGGNKGKWNNHQAI